MTLQLRQLLAIVGALHFHWVVRLLGGDHQTITDSHLDHVGQVVLALRIVVRQTAHPVSQTIGRDSKNAGVAFSNCALRFAGIFVLNDCGHLTVDIAHDAAVTGRVIQLDGEQAHLSRHDVLEQTLQGFDFDQRHVPVEDQHGVGSNERHRLSGGVAGAELLVLQDEIQIVGSQSLAHHVGAVTDHHMNALRIKLPGAVDNMTQHGVAGNRMQHFRQCRTHTSALTGREDNDFKRHDWLPILGGQQLRPGFGNSEKKKG
ncbi:hypothetical protein D3C87_1439450 [compost metagenome]